MEAEYDVIIVGCGPAGLAGHLMVKIHQTFNDQPKLVSELIDFLYSGQDEKRWLQ
jgi:lysine/ornithine N-monooxygenase